MSRLVRALRALPLTMVLVLVVAGTVAGPAAAVADEAGTQVGPPKSLADLKSIEAQVRKVVAEALPAVVAIRIGSTQGSGVVVGSEGYVLTAGHVVGTPGRDVTLIFPDGKTAKGKTQGVDRRADAGLVKISEKGDWPSIEMGHSEPLRPGDWCLALGHPLGYQDERPPVLRLGRVLRAEGTVIQTDCPLVAGDSGGPLLDLHGNVIGIHSRIADAASMNFHVPVDVFRRDWDRLVKGEAWSEGIPGKESEPVRKIFAQVVAAAAACAVSVRCHDGPVALGTVVGPDGWIVTKASELSGPAICVLTDGRRLEARVVGVQPAFDVAMLKVEAEGLPAIVWSRRAKVAVGTWVASPGPQGGPPLGIGVISVPRRKIPPAGGVLGVAVADGDGGARVVNVLPGTAAKTAGIEVDDVITHVNGKATPDQLAVIDAVRKHRPGDKVTLRIRRGDRSLTISARLTRVETPAIKRREMQNRSGGGVSRRHEDFPMVLQHDTVLNPAECGGPLVDLNGEVVGVNIARGGRTETYAVPTNVLLGLMYDLMSGRLAPLKPEPSEKPKPAAKPEAKPEKKPEPKQKPKTKPESGNGKKPEPKSLNDKEQAPKTSNGQKQN